LAWVMVTFAPPEFVRVSGWVPVALS
jgi:hypothetical protein